MTFFTFIIKDIARRKIRFALTFLGIAIGVATSVVMLGLSETIRDSFKNAYLKRDIDIVAFQKDQIYIFSSKVDASLSAQLRSFPEVLNATGVLVDFVGYQNHYLPVYGWELDSPLFGKIVMTQGRTPQAGKKEVMLGDVFAANCREKIGDTLEIKGVGFDIVGVYRSESTFEKSALIVPLESLQALDEKNKNTVMGINITLKNPYRNKLAIDSLAKKIAQRFPELTVQPTDLFIAERAKQNLLGDKLATLVAIITLIAVILGLANTMLTSIFEKKKLIGLLLVIGWETADLLKVLLAESLFIILSAGLAGTALGIYATDLMFKTMEVTLLLPTLGSGFLIKIFLSIFLAGIVSAIIPLWMISKLNPIETVKNG
jgi:putative ABC transport system permease protein